MAMFVFECYVYIFLFKQKTAYEMRISVWSSDVCSSDLLPVGVDDDRVALADQGDGAALVGFRRDVADDHAPGPAGEPAIGDEADAFAQSAPDDGRGRGQHLRHPGPALRPEIAQHQDVARDRKSTRLNSSH